MTEAAEGTLEHLQEKLKSVEEQFRTNKETILAVAAKLEEAKAFEQQLIGQATVLEGLIQEQAPDQVD